MSDERLSPDSSLPSPSPEPVANMKSGDAPVITMRHFDFCHAAAARFEDLARREFGGPQWTHAREANLEAARGMRELAQLIRPIVLSTASPSIQSSPPASEITEALDDLWIAGQELGASKHPRSRDAFIAKGAAARSRLETLYREQREEIERLRQPAMCGVCAGTGKPTSGLPCVCDGIGTEQAEMHGLRVECFRLEGDLSSLKEEQLTPEEAQVLLDDASTDDPRYEVWKSAIVKLRRLSQSRVTKEKQ